MALELIQSPSRINDIWYFGEVNYISKQNGEINNLNGRW